MKKEKQMRPRKNEYYTEYRGEIILIEQIERSMYKIVGYGPEKRLIRVKCEVFKNKKDCRDYFK